MNNTSFSRKLPDEVLLNVTNRIDPVGLHGLALVCRGVNHIIKECLLQKAAIKPNKIFQVIEELNQYPALASNMTHLRLGLIDDGRNTEILEMRPVYRDMPTADHRDYCEIIRKAHPETDITLLITALREVQEFFNIGLFLLIAQLHDLKTVMISDSTLEVLALPRILFQAIHIQDHRRAKWVEQVRSLLEKRLEHIIISEDDVSKHFRTDSLALRLPSFKLLKRLEVPVSKLHINVSKPWEILTRNIEELIVHFSISCRDLVTDWFLDILLRTSSHWRLLKSIDLRFDLNLYSAAQCYQCNRYHVHLLGRLKAHPTVQVQTLFGNISWY